MTDLGAGEHEFRFSGDHVECFIAPIEEAKATAWLERGAEALFLHTVSAREEELEDAKADPAFLGSFRDLRDAIRFEGCELRNGTFEVLDADGSEIETYSTESSEFSDFVDDVIEINPDTHVVDGQATLIVRTFYSGSTSFNFEVADPDDFGWYAVVMDMGSEPFVGSLNVNGEEVPAEGSGRYERQEVILNVPDQSGNVRSISHSERPEDI